MKKVLLGFMVGAVCGGAATWYALERERSPSLREAEQRAQALAEDARDAGMAAASRATEILEGKLGALDLDADRIREEMARTDRVVRRKARAFGQSVVSAATDARITGRVSSKFAADQELASLHLSVETADGVVTLSGEVASAEQVGKAILLAYETPDVREVVSTLTVRE
jgi:osmotically-inducible protein OsmY